MSSMKNGVGAVRAAVVLRASPRDCRNSAGEADHGLSVPLTTIEAVAAGGVWTRQIAAYQMSEVIL
jgi:hypothetical protein